jgi:hypothetical protein
LRVVGGLCAAQPEKRGARRLREAAVLLKTQEKGRRRAGDERHHRGGDPETGEHRSDKGDEFHDSASIHVAPHNVGSGATRFKTCCMWYARPATPGGRS